MTEKQKQEHDVLHRALTAKVTAKSRRVLESYLGVRDMWDNDWVPSDRPDFYRTFGDRIVGIEHFAVDKFSSVRGGNFQYFSRELQSEGEKIRKCWVDKIDTCDLAVPFGDVVELVGDIMVKESIIGDKNMMFALQSSIGRHVKRCAAYRKNLESISNGKSVKVGCLIELSGDFRDLILFEDGKIRQNDSGILPMSHCLIVLFSCALANGFDFVIFYRSAYSMTLNKSFGDFTLVMDQPVDFSDIGGYFHGEPVYGRIPVSFARNYKFKTDYGTQHNDETGTIDAMQNVSISGDGIDLQFYWKCAAMVINTIRVGGFCYCDLELAATVWVLERLQAKWSVCQYRNPETGVFENGLAPYGFNERLFEEQRIQFLLCHRIPGVLPMTLVRTFCKKTSDGDIVMGGWKRVETDMGRKRRGR